MSLSRFKLSIACFAALISVNIQAQIKLPSMGEASSAIISLDQERALGQSWLRSFRAQANLNSDYLLQEYVENLLLDMVRHSEIQDKRLSVVIVDNPSLNAFAVPGGIIGVNTGLFLYANNEDEFASVLAHELSHLSQRHFARSVEEQKISAKMSLAGLLAGIILAATTGSDAGLAMMTATQAAAMESSLKYSRQHEQEADRIGISVLANAGYDPQAMGNMFENMLKATRYVGYQAPEYLRTHPLTESRVNDAMARAQQFPERHYPDSGIYSLMRIRVEARESGSPDQAVQKFKARVKQLPSNENRYGLAMAYKNALKLAEAKDLAKDLYEQQSSNEFFGLLYAELLIVFGESKQAEQIIGKYLQNRPRSHALNMALANAKNQNSQFKEAADILRQQTIERPNDYAVWYEYAETLGLAGKILQLHKARAEYFTLVGAFDRAIRQLQYAKTEAAGNSIELAILDEKISRVAKLRNHSQF